MSSSPDRSFEQTTALLAALTEDPTQTTSTELVESRRVVDDLGDPSQEFSASMYLGAAVKHALDLLG